MSLRCARTARGRQNARHWTNVLQPLPLTERTRARVHSRLAAYNNEFLLTLPIEIYHRALQIISPNTHEYFSIAMTTLPQY